MSLSLFRKTPRLMESGILNGFIDYHSHLLPGVDDGVQTMEEAVEALARLEEWGVKTVWLTPHIMEDMPNTTKHLQEKFREIEAAYQGNINLRLGAENMIDTLFEERLANNDLLPIGENGNHLLVETSCFNPPMDLYGILEQIRQKGYHPVLAHPERYTYMSSKDYTRLKEKNIKLQLNLPSLVGMYGKTAQEKAKALLKKGLYDVSGSDIHALQTFTGAMLSRSYSSRYSCLASKLGQAFRI